ncbi:Cysteine synthase a [Lasiodiplodia theobromae]|uniref:Cysteine synthase a n=1 Tax=Lasiodiplodia theobromae TaxID=45133 RepID=UPI0015C3DDEB|nr:Cysteine synthase a [Lasiodiplodia theobromae]KAF4539637.1 Cysteine synthase a [Lasiodiplodia theobromae]
MPGSLHQSSHEASRPRKRLIVCCDGTWQASDKTYGITPSNIAKLSRMIDREDRDPEDDRVIPQVVYYQSGVGTGTAGPLAVGYEGSVGAGLSENVSTAYHYLSTNFHAKNRHEGFTNDEIFLFGFSRGAYTARVLCGLVTEMGLLRPQQLHEFPRAFEIYKKLSKMAAKKTDKGKPFIDWMDYFVGDLPASDRDFWHGLRVSSKMYDNVKVKAIGVWDTVGALGLPESWFSRTFPFFTKPFQFHNTGLNTNVENAFQALALDEHRGAFPPTLWYLPKRLLGDPNCPNLKQCWFPGFHDSIGGGGAKLQTWATQWFPKLMNWLMPDTSEMHEVTLAWMCDQINGLLRFDRRAVEDVLLQHGKTRGNWAACKEIDNAKLGWLIFYNPLAGSSHTRTPGQYYGEYRGCQTNETMHPSVYYRTNNVKRLHYTGRPLRERHVWAYSAWLPQFHFDVSIALAVLAKFFRLLTIGLYWLAAPVRAAFPNLWGYVSELWNLAGDLVHLTATALAHLGHLATMFPFTFFFLDEPLWRWQDKSTAPQKPDGASWVRGKVPPSVFLQDGQQEIHLQEWVIRESPAHDINFEKEMLPENFWKKLDKRNRDSIKRAEDSPDYRTQFWTRTEWNHRHDEPTKYSKYRSLHHHKQTTIPHPIHEFNRSIHNTLSDTHRVDEAADKIENEVRDNLYKVHDDLDSLSHDVRDGFNGAVGMAHDAVDKVLDDADALRHGAHDGFNDLHDGHDQGHNGFNGHDQSNPGKKNKKHAKHNGKHGEDDHLFNGGAVQYT